MTQISDLIARWNTAEGRPYKGSLIDWDAYKADENSIGCMCAQGQALHLVAGWTPVRLHNVGQAEADLETAKLLNINRAHAVLLREINDSVDGAPAIVLTDPGKVLGDQWSKLLDFWAYLDGLSAAQWAAARAAAGDAAGAAARDAARAAARDAARAAAGAAAWAAAGAAAWAAAWAAARASSEIQGAAIMREKCQPFFFLPLFGLASPDDIPARPANYGVQS